MIPVE
ncbi:hypothetical protein D046_8437A, partial [Vibrio parahaemolyticus V-223/04]